MDKDTKLPNNTTNGCGGCFPIFGLGESFYTNSRSPQLT